MFKLDCRLFTGYKPCVYQSSCNDCVHYQSMGMRILVIKLGAIGDALRTTPILEGLKKRYPESYITWVTDEASYPILEGNSHIDRLRILNFGTYLSLKKERFHLLLNFDKESEALGFAGEMEADKKMGFKISSEGKLAIYNRESSYGYELGLFDELKFRKSKKSYQEIIFEMAGLTFEGEEYSLYLSEEEVSFGEKFLTASGLNRDAQMLIGFNTGCGEAFATKKWTIDGFVELGEMLYSRFASAILLLGGPSETERNKKIEDALSFKIYNTGNNNSLKEFASLIRCCSAIITADTTAMHIAIALKVPVVALFGSTCHQEIFLYNRGEKVISDFPCSPCYKSKCEIKPNCMESISASKVMEIVEKLIKTGRF